MAPEQTRGEEVDHRADVWSLAVVLYEAISGGRPFKGDTHDDILRAIVSGEPVPLAAVPGDDGALWGILRKGLEKDPAKRFSSMRELGEALAAWVVARGVTEDIAGAAIETPWGPRSGAAEDDGLGTVRPLPFELAREGQDGRTTVRRGGSLAPRRRPPGLVLVIAGGAAVVGIALGVTFGGKRHSISPVGSETSSGFQAGAPLSSASPARGVPSGSPNFPIPVEPLDKIPVDGPPASKAAGTKTKVPGAFGHPLGGGAPRRTLKDPFR